VGKVTGVFTGMKGKVGNAVYAMWKGVQVIKTRVIPANPQSEAQTTNRNLFTNIISMFKGIVASLVTKFWDPFAAQYETGWSNLVGMNQAAGAGAAIDYEAIIVSHGSLPDETILTATYDDVAGGLIVTWADSGAEGSAPGDFALLLGYDSVGNKWIFSDGAALRSEETETITLEVGLTPANVYAYLFFFTGNFATPDITSVSNSDAKVTEAPAP